LTSLNRIARRLEEEGTIESESPAKYCFTVARLFSWSIRQADNNSCWRQSSRGASWSEAQPGKTLAPGKTAELFGALHRKLSRQPQHQSLLIWGRTRRIENRRALARSLGMTMNA
jgi:hypothetical protein